MPDDFKLDDEEYIQFMYEPADIYAKEMRTDYMYLVPFKILMVPIIYCVFSIVMSIALRKHIL